MAGELKYIPGGKREQGRSDFLDGCKAGMSVEERRALETLRKGFAGAIQALARAVESRDPYTAGHQRRVAELARAIASDMGLGKDSVDAVRMAGQIHDLGKIAVPAEILAKPGKLLESELELIRNHPVVGYQILKDVEFPWPIAGIVLQHHERVNGSGYPAGLRGTDILMEARVIGVADVVEAMASHRPYRAALGIEAALDEIRTNSGALYDLNVSDSCVRILTSGNYVLPE